MMKKLFSTRALFLFLTLAPLLLLAAGLTLGHFEHLQPCYLCNFQRFLYILTALFALFGVLFGAQKMRRFFAVLTALPAFAGVLTAAQQSYMQFAPEEVDACGFGPPTIPEQIVDALAEYSPYLFRVTGECTNKEWIFLKLSLANWSGICFLGLLLVALFLIWRKK